MHGGSPAAASQRKTVKEADKEATLSAGALIPDDRAQCVERIAPAHPPSRGRETCLILGFMGFLLLLSGSLLTRFKEPAHAKKRIAIHHAFVYSRGNVDDGQLKRLTRQLAALGLDRERMTVFARDGGERGNTSDHLYTASYTLTKDGRYGAELLAYRRLVRGIASYAQRAPAEPVILLTSQRAVVTPGGASVLDEVVSGVPSTPTRRWRRWR